MLDRKPYDNIFFMLTMALLLAGLFILASASMGFSATRFGYPYYYLLHQILFGALPGLILFFLASRIPYRLWKRMALPLILAAIFLMFLVFVPQLGFYHGGARRWISWGSVSFQPSEFLKFAYVVYLASWLETKEKEVGSFKFGFLPFSIMSAFLASFLVLQPDIGTLGVLLASVVALFFLSGGRTLHLAILVGAAAIIVAILILAEPYRLDRIAVFLNPSHDAQGVGYQANQALIAVGSGGFWGRGFGLSRQKFSYLPEPTGDSIFAIAAEEIGFIGSIALVILFLLFFWRGIIITNKCRDSFGRLVGIGFLFLIVFQAFINIAAIVGLLPLTGIPLSFVSYGGSALTLTLLEAGIILNISKKQNI